MKKQFDRFQTLIDYGRQFYDRRWMWGTSGNLSVRLKDDPLSIAITPSGLNKGHLTKKDLLTIVEGKKNIHPRGLVPSSETIIHQAIYHAVPKAQAVFHVHPMYCTLISKFCGNPSQVQKMTVDWMEVLKGVGMGEDENADIMILPNWQDVSKIANDITDYVKTAKRLIPAVLIYNHGLTGWAETPDQARNTLEIMEYVSQYLYLKRLAGEKSL